jgi:hypothetical protein
MFSWQHGLSEFRGRIGGPVITAESDPAGYDLELSVFNQSVEHRPGVVVGASSAADVCQAVTFAASHDMTIAVVNTGHGPSVAAGPQTLLITTRRMNDIDIDGDSRTARVSAGVRFGQLVDAAARHGLAPLSGSAPGVGVVGYTLGGGVSLTMGRKYGWASDHVRAMDVVTADGHMQHVTPRSQPDLFGALLGGKSNFGVVTAMHFALFPVTGLYAGALYFAGEHAREVFRAYHRFTANAPDDITTGIALLNFPPLPELPPFMQGNLTVALRISYLGDSSAGAKLIEPLRRCAPMLADTVAEITYQQFGSITNDPTEPGVAVEHFGLLRELTDDTVDAILSTAGPNTGSGVNIIDVRHLRGAFGNPAPFDNAVGARDAAFAYFALTAVPPGHHVDDFRDAGRELTTALAPWLHDNAHPSYIGPADATDAGTSRAYHPDVYGRLQDVKSTYDPHNRFQVNHNIPPHPATRRWIDHGPGMSPAAPLD